MTLKQNLAKEKLVNKYEIEVGNYEEAIRRGGLFTEFNIKKATEFQAKIDALNVLIN